MDDKAITFDFHNTLVHCDDWFDLEVRHLASAFLRWDAGRDAVSVSEETLAAADAAYRRLRQRIKEHGSEEPAERCVTLVLSEIGISHDETTIASGVESLMRDTLASARVMPGAAETVRSLYAFGVSLGIVSSAVYHPFLEWCLQAFGVRECFAAVITSASAGFYKSQPQIYLHAAERLGVKPGSVVHVGDSYRFDVQGASRAGMRTVWLRHDPADRPEPDGPAPDLTLPSLTDATKPLLNLLRSPTT